MSSILSSSTIKNIISEVRTIVSDDELAVTINYKLSGATVSTWNPTTAIIPDMYSVSSVSAIKTSLDLSEERQKSVENRSEFEISELLEFGDTRFIIMRSDVSKILSVDDMIWESSTNYQSATTYQISAISKDPLNICYFVDAKTI